MAEGSPDGSVLLALDGEYDLTKRSEGREVSIAHRGPGDIFGEISLLDQSPRTASVRAIRDGPLLEISQSAFRQVLFSHPTSMLAILRTITAKLRNTETMPRHSEKMASLGALTAGMAHELNNPAAAARRASTHLREGLDAWSRLNGELFTMGIDPATLLRATAASDQPDRDRAGSESDPLARADEEAEVQAWLKARGVDDTWEIAPSLVEAGLEPPTLELMARELSSDQLTVAARWLATDITLRALADEVDESVGRISEIVKAVKSYSYLDQASVQDVDMREGIENTLVILRHKLKGVIQVRRDYVSDLPRIEAYGSELNQLWTNILDNATDVLQGGGEIVIRVYRQEESVVVEMTDNGPGIPAQDQSRIFDPLFTTKPLGAGTGLGLHLSYNIVVQKHQGQIQVLSRPGETTFKVTLPIRLKRGA
jgi:signal transduction histidine kinase